MYNDIIINGLPITVSGNNIEIFDPMHDVEEVEAQVIVNYLHEEGFFLGRQAKYVVIRGDIE